MRASPTSLTLGATLAVMCAAFPRAANGMLIPGFSLDFSARKATHIVVAAEGERVDGVLQVLDSWKGDLRKGDTVTVPELAQFASEDSRAIGMRSAQPRKPASGARMILFLVKSLEPLPGAELGREVAASRTKWLPASSPDYRPVGAGGDEPRDYLERMKISVAWVENGTMHAFHQLFNPGPLVLMANGRMAEEEAKARTLDLIKGSSDFEKAAALPDASLRVAALLPHTEATEHRARERAFNALGECGAPALPIIRRMLQDASLADHHYLAVKALAKAGGSYVGPELAALLRLELMFWKRQAPLVIATQWNDFPAALRARHVKLEQALHAVAWVRCAGAREAVAAVRDYWESEPRLNRLTGGPRLNAITHRCNAYLDAATPKRSE